MRNGRGREGELIFRYIYEETGSKLPITRLWISSQTDAAIKDGFDNLHDAKNYEGLYDSARCRSEADWLIGMNATRAYTVHASNGNGVMSVGRVQTPVLKMIVDRYRAHTNFKSEPFYEIKASFNHENGEYEGQWFSEKSDRFSKKSDAEAVLKRCELAQSRLIQSMSSKKKKEKPPLLYDLTEMQREANRRFKYSADQTLKIMQRLYEQHKVVTYPRTSSRYLSKDMEPKLKERIQNTQFSEDYAPFSKKNIGKKIADKQAHYR